MRFLVPMAFWFAAVMPVVVVFYLLKRKREVRLVSSTVLWQRYLEDVQTSAPFQRLRRNWLLLLQLLVMGLVILALARPYFAARLSPSRLHVVVLDASASMQCTDEAPSRFERARAGALELVNALRDSDQMIVLEAGGQAVVRQSTTGNKAALRRALGACTAGDTSTRLTEALKMAASLTRDNDQAEVHLFSDGAAGDLSELQNLGLRLVYHQVGRRAENAGITRLEVRAVPESPGDCAVFTTVANVSEVARERRIELWHEGQLVGNRLVRLPATNAVSLAFRVASPGEGVFRVRLTGGDDLAVDDEAASIWREPRPVRVVLVTRGNPYLERALRAVGSSEVRVVTEWGEDRVEADLIVLDNVRPETWPELNVLAIAVEEAGWFGEVKEVERPAIVDWRVEHPLLRHVSFENVHVRQSKAVATPTWALPVVESSGAPLILAGERGRRRIVWVGFDLWESDWPLRISFPIFVANAVGWLNPAELEGESRGVPAGEPIRLRLEPGVREAEVVRPDGVAERLPLGPSAGEVVYGRTERQGVYQVRVGAQEVRIAVNLLDAAETQVQPRAELDFGRYGAVGASVVRSANLEVWRWFVVVGLGMMALEWWYYHRRTA